MSRTLFFSPRTFQQQQRRQASGWVERMNDWIARIRPEGGPRQIVANNTVNRYKPERVMLMGPDLACLEWLMKCGCTWVIMSDGQKISSQREMRKFITSQGIDIKNIKKLAPDVSVIKDFNSKMMFDSSMKDDSAYEKRWPKVSPIHIKEVDASDSAMTNQGFQYFRECRRIERLKLNHTDYCGNLGIRELALSRPATTLLDLEICLNSQISDDCTYWLGKIKSLRRLHLYFLPWVSKRNAMLRQLRLSLPHCKVTYPETYYIGYGYEEGTPRSNKDEAEQRSRRI